MWFKKHPNWTIFFSWLAAGIIMNVARYTITDADSSIWWVILAICILLVWGTLAWSLSVKHQSYFHLFLLLIPLIGMIIVWCLSDKSKPEENKQIENETSAKSPDINN